MTLVICPKCTKDYKYPSVLLKHLKTSSRCLTSNEEIKTYFENYKNVKISKKKIISCNICDIVFTKTSSLKRHLNNICCKVNIENSSNITNQTNTNTNTNNTNNTNTNTNSYNNIDIVNIIKKLPQDLALNFLEFLANKTTNNITNNTTNTTNTTNNNIQNNLIQNNTNNITIQHISPFGFEDVRKIPLPEMIKILKSGLNSGILIIKVIYNQIENKNFYRPNIGKSDIACLNDSFDLTIYKGNQFADVLFDRCITLLHHMLHLCKTELSILEIKLIYDNIEYIETSMRTEIYEKKLQNIIESEVRNNNANNKSSISKYVKYIKKSPEIKTNATNVLNNIKQLNNDVSKDLQISIKDEEFNEALGDSELYFNLTKEEHDFEFQVKQYQDTQFYSYWKNRIVQEKDYIENKEEKTIGDIVNIYKRKENIKMKLDVVGDRHKFLQFGEIIDLEVKNDYYTSKSNDDISVF